MEREIENLGVSAKQKAKARVAFENSAQQTGFRDVAPNKLVMPAVAVTDDKPSGNGGDSGDGGGTDKLDPLIQALIDKIPLDGKWQANSRLRWFRTLAMNVSQVYDNEDKAVELEIKLISGGGQEGDQDDDQK